MNEQQQIEYLEAFDRDFDYYLFWADEFQQENWELICECSSLMKLQIACAHILMDNGQETNYQEDGFILGEIIWESIKGED